MATNEIAEMSAREVAETASNWLDYVQWSYAGLHFLVVFVILNGMGSADVSGDVFALVILYILVTAGLARWAHRKLFGSWL